MVRLAAPGVGERGDEEQTASGIAVRVRRRCGETLASGVRDLDAQGAGREGQGEAGVAAPYAAVQGGVRGEFRDEEGGRGRVLVAGRDLRAVPLVGEPAFGGVAGGVGAVAARGEGEAEVMSGGGRFTGDGDGLLDHLTEGDGALLLCEGCGGGTEGDCPGAEGGMSGRTAVTWPDVPHSPLIRRKWAVVRDGGTGGRFGGSHRW
ncbi:hypothetical protein Shyhy02_28420 [Streptomyces hygroscopicus subsp. hygroscopicus]|nr:hypothetical protein Shyhy02_28420 [Streptomyces hygroscopicus subsp. hygroscopicus]